MPKGRSRSSGLLHRRLSLAVEGATAVEAVEDVQGSLADSAAFNQVVE
ncbi:MAG: hypothetical protein HXY20_11205 [Acidobacteria bacterium]|nr:hypothetical protein [Acidobacteriota bacterium]